MKCPDCEKTIRMKFGQAELDFHGRRIAFTNIPVNVCPCCGMQRISENILRKAEIFSSLVKDAQIDFEQCENRFEIIMA